MNIFSDRSGHVVLLPDAGLPFSMSLQYWTGASAMQSIMTSVSIASQGNFQFMHTLRNLIYVYVFGEKIGEIELGGLSFAGQCNQAGDTGIERLWKYYNRYRIAQRGAPITLAIGATLSFQGWLTGVKIGLADTQSGVAQFALRFNFFPGRLITNANNTLDFLNPLPPLPLVLQTGIVAPPPGTTPPIFRRST